MRPVPECRQWALENILNVPFIDKTAQGIFHRLPRGQRDRLPTICGLQMHSVQGIVGQQRGNGETSTLQMLRKYEFVAEQSRQPSIVDSILDPFGFLERNIVEYVRDVFSVQETGEVVCGKASFRQATLHKLPGHPREAFTFWIGNYLNEITAYHYKSFKESRELCH